MNKLVGSSIAVLAPLVLLFGLLGGLGGLPAGQASATWQTDAPGEPNRRERQPAPDAPTISFIDSQTPQCRMVDRERDLCSITFNYLSVTADSGQYVISMSVRIDNRIRGYYSGFFQNSMYVPGDMHPDGFLVRCGPPGSGGNAYLGKSYSFVIQARESDGQTATNFGSVACPAGLRVQHLPLVRKN